MAKLSAHGKEVGTVYFLTSAKRYMSDGKILKNFGFGWKISTGRIKPELAHLTPQQLFDRQREYENKFTQEKPEAAEYKKQLHLLCGLSKRWKLHAAIQMMPDDPDGVWSECCDGYGENIHADIDDIVNLCRLYKLAEMRERIRREGGK